MNLNEEISKIRNMMGLLNEDDRPPMMGTQHNQINILYKLTALMLVLKKKNGY